MRRVTSSRLHIFSLEKKRTCRNSSRCFQEDYVIRVILMQLPYWCCSVTRGKHGLVAITLADTTSAGISSSLTQHKTAHALLLGVSIQLYLQWTVLQKNLCY